MVEFGVGHVMAWGCIKSDWGRKLVKVDGKLNSEKYITLLWSNLLPHYKDGDVFWHGYAP